MTRVYLQGCSTVRFRLAPHPQLDVGGSAVPTGAGVGRAEAEGDRVVLDRLVIFLGPGGSKTRIAVVEVEDSSSSSGEGEKEEMKKEGSKTALPSAADGKGSSPKPPTPAAATSAAALRGAPDSSQKKVRIPVVQVDDDSSDEGSEGGEGGGGGGQGGQKEEGDKGKTSPVTPLSAAAPVASPGAKSPGPKPASSRSLSSLSRGGCHSAEGQGERALRQVGVLGSHPMLYRGHGAPT